VSASRRLATLNLNSVECAEEALLCCSDLEAYLSYLVKQHFALCWDVSRFAV